PKQDQTQRYPLNLPTTPSSAFLRSSFVPFCGSLFVDIIEAGEFPTRSGFFEVINDDFVSSRVGTRYAGVFRILRVQLGLGFSEASCCVRLIIEDLFVALRELRFRFYGGYAVRHSDRKLRESRDRLDVAFADRSLKILPECFERGVRRLAGKEKDQG